MSRRQVIACLASVALLVALLLGQEPLLRLYYRVEYESAILREAQRQGVSPHLLAAVLFTESRFRARSESDVGARGLMQLMPDTAAEMALKEGLIEYSTSRVEEPDINIRLGTAYLAELIDRFSTLEEALAAYNAGPTVVRTWREKGSGIPFEETRAYVENVKRHKAALQRLYPDWESSSR